MNLTQVLILGIVQGATEFLPISSTAHLILLPRFFGFPDPGLTFDISLHFGTLLAILIYFRREWVAILKGKLILFATIPAIFFGVLFESWAETGLRSPSLIAVTLVVFGLILWLVDKKISHLGHLSYLSKTQAFFIGLWQALAIVPGVSRSGASITGGLLVGLKREAAVKFSFLLSAPIIFGSTLVGIFKITNSQLLITNYELLLGILTSFLSGLLAIKFLLNFVKSRSFLPFVVYRLVLAILILLRS
jgi:undecaprenyl-diphosphatase